MVAILRPLAPYLMAAVVAVVGALWLRAIMDQRDQALADLTAVQRELAVQRTVSDLRAFARDEALAEADRLREAAEAFDAIRDESKGDDVDDPLPPSLADALRRLRAPR